MLIGGLLRACASVTFFLLRWTRRAVAPINNQGSPLRLSMGSADDETLPSPKLHKDSGGLTAVQLTDDQIMALHYYSACVLYMRRPRAGLNYPAVPNLAVSGSARTYARAGTTPRRLACTLHRVSW